MKNRRFWLNIVLYLPAMFVLVASLDALVQPALAEEELEYCHLLCCDVTAKCSAIYNQGQCYNTGPDNSMFIVSNPVVPVCIDREAPVDYCRRSKTKQECTIVRFYSAQNCPPEHAADDTFVLKRVQRCEILSSIGCDQQWAGQ